MLSAVAAGRRSIDISCPRGTQQQTAATMIDGADGRRTNGRTHDHFVDLAAYTVQTVTKLWVVIKNISLPRYAT